MSQQALDTAQNAAPNDVHGFRQMWLDNNAIVVFTLTETHRDAVDMWAQAVATALLTWPEDKPYLSMHDLSLKHLAFTPYVRQKSQELARLRPQIRGYSAIILPQSIMGTMLRFFVQSEVRTVQVALERAYFFQQEAALTWLRTQAGLLVAGGGAI